jgi:hypothetical protein
MVEPRHPVEGDAARTRNLSGAATALARCFGLRSLAGLFPVQVLRTDLTRTQEFEALGQEDLQFVDAAAFEQHVPVRPRRLHVLGLGSIAVDPDGLASAAWALPHRRDLGVSGEWQLEVVGMRAVVCDQLAWSRGNLPIILIARRTKPGAS